jgi:hypothetical protein
MCELIGMVSILYGVNLTQDRDQQRGLMSIRVP